MTYAQNFKPLALVLLIGMLYFSALARQARQNRKP